MLLTILLRHSMKIKFKKIVQDGIPFLRRLSIYTKTGSIKFHLMTRDDTCRPHTHPWNYVSFLILPYKEWLDGVQLCHHPFSLLSRTMNQRHRITLYNLWGVRIPAFTIGNYGQKKQLCSLCQSLGYCRTTGKKIDE